jgi:hypothetical protein
VAPLTATLAAAVAVGVGVALARAGRERDRALRVRGRELGLQPGEPPAQALKRMALGQLDMALELLEDGGRGASAAEATVHDTRKALKRLRALLRLLEGELTRAELAREQAALRRAARELAGARDAEVMLNTLEALIERHPRKLGRRKGVRRLRRALLAQRERAAQATLDHGDTLAVITTELRGLRARVELWDLRAGGESQQVASGLSKLYAQGRIRHERAARRKGKDSAAMHEWRKHVKHLRYAAEMLERHPPAQTKPSRRAAQLQRVAARADRLAETLGEEHDLAVLGDWVKQRGAKRGKHRRPGGSKALRVDRGTRKILLELIERRRRKLRRRALRDGERLYRSSRKRFVRSLR